MNCLSELQILLPLLFQIATSAGTFSLNIKLSLEMYFLEPLEEGSPSIFSLLWYGRRSAH